MTDVELIARLREIGKFSFGWTADQAADRIEALIAERDALFRRATLAEEWRDHDKTRAEAAEAKLAENEVRLRKAVEALEKICDRHIPDQPAAYGGDEADWARRQHTALRRIARAALAEITGGKDE